MTTIKFLTIIFAIIFFVSVSALLSSEKSSVCFTFDDGNPNDILDYKNEQWNRMILDVLKKHNLQAVLYVCGKNLDNPEGKKIIESWNYAGHLITNHTYSHSNYNNEQYTFDEFKNDFLRCDSLINNYENYRKFFRAPYLKYGETKEKRDSLNAFLKNLNYKSGYVTIDGSDWYYNSKLIEFIKNNPGKSIEPYKELYIEHLLDRAKYYDDLAFKVLGKKVKHSILLHHNLTSALFLDDLINAFEKEGWQILNASDALTDDIYQMIPDIVPAGESIIWGLAKETGKYDDVLRYPAEDSQYEEDKFNKLGL